jgi:sulfur carrier protein
MIAVYVNNKTTEVPENTSIESLLLYLNQKRDGIAIAVNDLIITKSKWDLKFLSEKDNVLIIQATQGG